MSVPFVGRKAGNFCPRRPRSCPQWQPPIAFVNPKANGVLVRTRQVGRSLEFWGRVISIWTSFKVTQAYVALQQRYRAEDWPRRVWNAQHERAGNKMLELCTSMKGFYVKSGSFNSAISISLIGLHKARTFLRSEMLTKIAG